MSTSALEPRARPYEPETEDGAGVPPSFLDRTIDLSAVGWVAVGWVVVAAVALALRLAQLDVWALTPEEARRAYEAYSLYIGRPSDPGEALPETAPLFLLLQAFGFFLFGTTDAIARIVPALLGVSLVPLAWLLRPFVGKTAALGMAALAALSPVLVYASRLGTPDILVAATSLAVVVVALRIGLPATNDGAVRRRCAVAGIALGLLIASGPLAPTVLIALAVGAGAAALFARPAAGTSRDDALVRSGRAIARVPGTIASGAAGLLATLLVLFTRLFSDIGAIGGLGETIGDWARLVGSDPGTVPTQYFLLSLLLYEPLAVAFALVASRRLSAAPAAEESAPEAGGGIGAAFFAGWFVAALLLFSLFSGARPEHLIQIALPLVLLGGIGLGDLLARVVWRDVFRGAGGLLALVYLGLLVGLAAFGILAGRIDEAPSEGRALVEALFVLCLVVLPLGYALFVLVQGERAAVARAQVGWIALFVAALVLGAFVLRSSILLNFYNADEGTEPLAQRTATGAVRPMVERLMRLSRDTTLNRASIRDVTGGRSLVIALDERVEWPFRWYFREFPDLEVVAPGTAPGTEAEVVIAPDETGMAEAEAAYTPRTYPYLNRVPAAYSDPNTGDVLETLFNPTRWIDGVRYLLYRELDNPAVAETVAVGLNGELALQVAPSSGPSNLFDQAGAGGGRGQFSLPRGIAVDQETGVSYVVDMGNLRVERFDADGTFIGIWGGGEEGGVIFGAAEGAGPTGITVGPDGLVYVADTWNHRVVALDESGQIVREIGSEVVLPDDPAQVVQSFGYFFGPRAVLVYNDEIYVVDTGNERIQVFGLDGTFRRLWGGYGSAPDQLREPVGIAVGPDGLLYVADSHNARISVFAPDGQPVRQIPVPAWQGSSYIEPYLTFGLDGLLYATSRVTESVEVFDLAGNPVDSIREVDGEALQQPIGIATGVDGAILITDSGRSGVYRYLPPTLPVEVVDDGAVTTEGSPVSSTGGDGTGGASSDIVLPGGATPAADGGAGGAAGGSNQAPLVVPTNRAPPPLTGGG